MTLNKGISHRCSAKHIDLFTAIVLSFLSVSACVVVAHRVEVQPIDSKQEIVIETPVEVHLTDGSTGLYADGASVANGTLRGKGYYYDITLKPFPTNPVLAPMPFSSIAVAETYHESVNKGATAAYLPLSILASVAAMGTGAGGSVKAGTVLDNFPRFWSKRSSEICSYFVPKREQLQSNRKLCGFIKICQKLFSY